MDRVNALGRRSATIAHRRSSVDDPRTNVGIDLGCGEAWNAVRGKSISRRWRGEKGASWTSSGRVIRTRNVVSERIASVLDERNMALVLERAWSELLALLSWVVAERSLLDMRRNLVLRMVRVVLL